MIGYFWINLGGAFGSIGRANVRVSSDRSIIRVALDFAPLLWRLAWLRPVEPPKWPACLPAEA